MPELKGGRVCLSSLDSQLPVIIHSMHPALPSCGLKAKLVLPADMVGPPLGATSSAVGLLSAAVGAGVAKLWTDKDVQAMDRRLEEVKSQAPQSSPAEVDPVVAARHLLETVDWGLANEERRRPQCTSDLLKDCFAFSQSEDTRAQNLGGSSQKQYERHLRKVRQLCAAPSCKKAPELCAQMHSRVHATTPRRKESSQRLFDPQHGTVRDKLGLCAALAYVVYEFLQLRHGAPGNLQDSPRKSLRLALTSLAQHEAFARSKEEYLPQSLQGKGGSSGNCQKQSWWQQAPCAEREFRSAAVILICTLDAALSWSPLDPFGWTGKPEDAEGALLSRQRDSCGFAAFANKLRTCLKAACSSSVKAMRRMEGHLASVRRRELPKPWTTAWVRNDAGPMIVRNRTKVPLRIELHPSEAPDKSWSTDWPAVKQLLELFQSSRELVLAAKVEPGVEWALRPKKEAGKEFQLHMLTTSGVRVCSRRMCRGESFDFRVNIPPKPAQLRTWMKDEAFGNTEFVASRRLSQASTASTRASTAASDLSAVAAMQPKQDKARDAFTNVVDGFTSCLCPHCLSVMECRAARPRAAVYAGGVSCDHCQVQLFGEEALETKAQSTASNLFCHCSHCQFDLCRVCAYKEMQQVWWQQV